MEIDLDTILEMDKIDPSPTHTITQLGYMCDTSNIVTALNLTSFSTKEMVNTISIIFKEKITSLEEKYKKLSDQLLNNLRYGGMICTDDIDNLVKSVEYLILYINTKKPDTVEKYQKYGNKYIYKIDDIFDICNLFVTDYELEEKEIKIYDEIAPLITEICTKEGIRMI